MPRRALTCIGPNPEAHAEALLEEQLLGLLLIAH